MAAECHHGRRSGSAAGTSVRSMGVVTKGAAGSARLASTETTQIRPGFPASNGWCPEEESEPRRCAFVRCSTSWALGRRRRARSPRRSFACPDLEGAGLAAPLIISGSGSAEIEADGAAAWRSRCNGIIQIPTATQTACLKHSPQINQPPYSPSLIRDNEDDALLLLRLLHRGRLPVTQRTPLHPSALARGAAERTGGTSSSATSMPPLRCPGGAPEIIKATSLERAVAIIVSGPHQRRRGGFRNACRRALSPKNNLDACFRRWSRTARRPVNRANGARPIPRYPGERARRSWPPTPGVISRYAVGAARGLTASPIPAETCEDATRA